MAKHLFLTGEKGVGKSTLIKGLLAQYHGSLGGFFTVKSAFAVPGRISVHLLRADRRERPTLENLLFSCGEPAGPAVTDRFDRLGCAALTAEPSADLLVMDELGPHEADARSFCRAALQALDGNIPILGVLQRADVPFFSADRRPPSGPASGGDREKSGRAGPDSIPANSDGEDRRNPS